MKANIEKITPFEAKVYLRQSKGNRPLKKAKIASYGRDMKSGKWVSNGETVIFDAEGALIDGHHRLNACVKYDAPFETIVVRGAPVEAQKTIDMGAARTVGDALAFHGYKNSNHMNAVVLALASLKNGRPRSANLSAAEVFEFVQNNPFVEQAAVVAARKNLPRAQSILGAIWFVAAVNQEEHVADAFLEVLNTGYSSKIGCPAHALRERIMRDMMSSKKMALSDVHALCVAAWNKFREGVTCKRIFVPAKYEIDGW